MSKKKKELTIDDILEPIYYFLKNKLNFDDIQAITFISSLVLIPTSLLLGFSYTKISTFQIALYITLGIDLIVILYSIVKFKYFKNKRINFVKELQNNTIEINSMDDVDNMNSIEFEFFVRELFTKQGYKSWTTKKTHDNGADVVAEKNNERIAIQVKHSAKTINGYGVYQAERGKHNYKADRAILITNSEFTNQAKLDANRLDVKLIDEHDISLFLRKNPNIKFTYKK